jgi:hypothetical protein
MQRTRASLLVAAAAVALVLAALPGCSRKPKETTAGSTDTIQSTAPQTTGTTATETGGGPPVTTSNATGTAVTTDTVATAGGTAGATGTH